MKLRSLFPIYCLTALAVTACFAEDNLLLNGAFESWESGVPVDWSTNNVAGITQVQGLGSGNAALVMANSDLRQLVSGSSKNFTIKFLFTVNQSPDVSAFSQSLVLSIYQTSSLMASGEAWISIRVQTNKASEMPFSIAAFDGSEWRTLTEAVITPSILSDDQRSLASASVYEMAVSYSASSNTYSISYGPMGGKMKEISSLSFFRNPTTKDGLVGLQFYSNDNGFALDDVVVTKKR